MAYRKDLKRREEEDFLIHTQIKLYSHNTRDIDGYSRVRNDNRLNTNTTVS